MTDVIRRQKALEATMEKYRGKALDFKTADCVRMARFHLIQMGHKVPKLPRYQSSVGAIRALKAAGGMVAILDSFLPQIPYARMLPGDLAVLEGEDDMDAVVICVGHKVMGWHQDADTLVNIIPNQIKAAWRA